MILRGTVPTFFANENNFFVAYSLESSLEVAWRLSSRWIIKFTVTQIEMMSSFLPPKSDLFLSWNTLDWGSSSTNGIGGARLKENVQFWKPWSSGCVYTCISFSLVGNKTMTREQPPSFCRLAIIRLNGWIWQEFGKETSCAIGRLLRDSFSMSPSAGGRSDIYLCYDTNVSNWDELVSNVCRLAPWWSKWWWALTMYFVNSCYGVKVAHHLDCSATTIVVWYN